MILCLWYPLHPLSKLLAIQDHAQNLEEQLWMGGRREVSIISHRPMTRRDLKQETLFFRGSVPTFLQLVVACTSSRQWSWAIINARAAHEKRRECEWLERSGELATISHKFSFPPQKPHTHTKTRLLKEAMDVDLLVWIVGYKLSRIYNIPWIEFSRDLSLQSCCFLFKLWHHHKIAFVTLHFVKKNRLFILQWFSFFLEEIDLRHICFDMKSTDFIVGKFLDTVCTTVLDPDLEISGGSHPFFSK